MLFWWTQDDSQCPFKELLKLIAAAFGSTRPQDIKCFVVGDHSLGNPVHSMKNMGINLVRDLNKVGDDIDTHLFKVFDGATVETWLRNRLETNNRLYETHQCFFYVGLDCCTGKLLVHTRFFDDTNPCPLWPPQRLCDVEQSTFPSYPLFNIPYSIRNIQYSIFNIPGF
jgi:hypothetical protein